MHHPALPTTEIELQPFLEGETIVLRPLLAGDLEPLYEAASDPLIWAQHPEPLRYQRSVFETNFFAGALACESALVAVEKASGRILGSSRYKIEAPSPPSSSQETPAR